MPWIPEVYAVIIPDPYDPQDRWADVGTFKTKEEAVAYVRDTFGGDGEGRIQTLSHPGDGGWLVDLPNPRRPEDPWVLIDSFDRKRDAIRFVKERYGGDAQGRVGVIDVMESWEEPKGPKDWSPRERPRK